MNKTVFLIAIALVLIGCTQPATNTNQNNNSNSGLTIQEILEKGKNVNNIQYDISLSVNGTAVPITMTTHQKNSKYKIEAEFMGQKTATVFDGINEYTYDYSSDVYYKTGTDSVSSNTIDFADFAEQALNDSGMTEQGKQEINGMQTRIIEFSFVSNETTTQTKAWISEEYGIPVKLETTTDSGNAVLEIKNIKMNSVEDSVFVVPEEKIQDLNDLIPDENI